jgi:hypothetical protein
VKWFGSPWPSSANPAPVCDPADRIPVPLGMRCVRCEKGFTLNDQGFELPLVDEGRRVRAVYYHKGCFLREVGVVRDVADAPSAPAPKDEAVPMPTPAEDAKALRDELNRVADERRERAKAAKDSKDTK